MSKMKTSNTALVILVAVLVLAGGGAYAYSRTYDDKEAASSNTEVMEKTESDSAMEKDVNNNGAMEKNPEEAMEKTEDGAMMKKSESYVTLADFNSSKDTYSDSVKVLFFHASWCSICQGIEKEINAQPTRIPEGTTFIKTDFDSEKDLRKKYGVNNQYTFVQIDNEGNQIAKWSATSLDKAIAGIKS